jgi:hypothetical protein
MKKIVLVAALLLSSLTFAQTAEKAKAKAKKEVKTNANATKAKANSTATEATKKVEDVKTTEQNGVMGKINKTAKTVEEKANMPLINENSTVKKVKDGAVKVKEITN